MSDGSHKNIRLTAAWRKYGPSSFEFTIIEQGLARGCLIAREQYWITTLQSDGRNGYNILPCAGSRAGTKSTPATLAKLSAASTGRRHTQQTREKLSAVLKGKIRTDEMKATIQAAAVASNARKTPEQRSAAALKGYATLMAKRAAMSPEELAELAARRSASATKASATKRARGLVVSDETKARQMAARVRRGVEERRAIALRAWETKRAKKQGG
jgi:group I intron endonuclease